MNIIFQSARGQILGNSVNHFKPGNVKQGEKKRKKKYTDI